VPPLLVCNIQALGVRCRATVLCLRSTSLLSVFVRPQKKKRRAARITTLIAPMTMPAIAPGARGFCVALSHRGRRMKGCYLVKGILLEKAPLD
jgi:hypothetical protein